MTPAQRAYKRERARLWRARNPVKAKANSARCRARHREKFKKSCRDWYRLVKAEVLDAYGHRCECCGESTAEFLAIDHIKGDGAAHRREVGGGTAFYLWLRRAGFPRDNFRLLCHNCNIARAYGQKICPHELARHVEALLCA